jgi:hypothetical protein
MDNEPVWISSGYHRLTGFELGCVLRERIEAIPAQGFADLQAGETYIYRSGYGRGDGTVYVVLGVAPKRGQARVVLHNDRGGEFKIYKGSSGGVFRRLDAHLIAMLGVDHARVVGDAVARGLDVPPSVRREHPAMFIEIPERFAKPEEWDAKTPNDRVRKALTSHGFGGAPPDAKAVDVWIEQAHRDLVRFRDEGVRRVAVNPETAAEYERAEAEFHELIDFYRWIRPLVEPGGVFFVEQADR